MGTIERTERMNTRRQLPGESWLAFCDRRHAEATARTHQNQDLSNLNFKGSSNLNPSLTGGSSGLNNQNLSNLSASARKNPNKLTRRQLSENPALLRLLEWE